MNEGSGPHGVIIVGKQTCTIRPRWLNVNVTYVRDGFVTLEPMTPQLPDIPFNSSMLIQSTIETLKKHLSNSQTMSQNHITNTIIQLTQLLPDGTPVSYSEEFVTKKMVSIDYTIAPSHPRE